MAIEEAKEYVLSKVINPALESPTISQGIKNSIIKTKQWVNHFKYVGDLYAYITRFKNEDSDRYEEIYSELKNNNLTPMEDIVDSFKIKFEKYLGETLDISMLEVGKTYSSWDISTMARVFNIQRGIYVLGDSENIKGILSKVTIGGDSTYPNSWIEYGKTLKHSMLTFKGTTDINFESNKAIIQSNGIPIHIFLKEGTECIYDGIYDYVNWIEGQNGGKWFVLKKRQLDSPQKFANYVEALEESIRRSKALSHERRSDLIRNSTPVPVKRLALVEVYDRNPNIIAEVLIRASGNCEECLQPAPFMRASDGTPYLEVHHVIPLAQGGEDSLENVVAICPNCHRKAHYG